MRRQLRYVHGDKLSIKRSVAEIRRYRRFECNGRLGVSNNEKRIKKESNDPNKK